VPRPPGRGGRLTLAGVGGAFRRREDVVHAGPRVPVALRTTAAGQMVYSREESFVGHVTATRARLEYGTARPADGRLASSAPASCSTAARTRPARRPSPPTPPARGRPLRCPNATIDAIVAFTNNPTCGAMRGFGAVRPAFAYEAQMDRLAAELGLHPLDLRARKRDARGRRRPPHGQEIGGPVPVAVLL